MGLPVTLPQASWPERWQLLKGCSPGPALPCPPLSPSLLSLKKVTPGICRAQALQFCTLKPNFNMAILSYQAPHGTTRRRTAQGPSMMKTAITGKAHCSPGLCQSLPLGRRGVAGRHSGNFLCCRPCCACEFLICPWRGVISSFRDRVVIVPTHHPWLQGELASGNVGATRTGLCVPVRSPRASVHVCT